MKKEITQENKKKLDALASYLKSLRLCYGLNQSEIEGFHYNTISRIENSKNYSIQTLLCICEIYDIKPSELMSILD